MVSPTIDPGKSLNRARRESRVRRWWRSPVFLLALTAGLSAFVIQSGELGTADTTVRLQTATWLWTDEPQVPLDGFPEFVIHGRGGKPYSWYGIGQSLLMLPADIVGTKLEQLPVFAGYDVDPGVRSIVVSYSTNILINVLTALVCFRFLRLLRFSTRQSVAGVMALLFCTTHLHYAQNMMENNYIMLLTLTGLTFQYEWLLTGSRRALLVGSTAFGLNLLTRLTTGLDLLAGGVFLLLVLWFDEVRGRGLWQRFVTYAKIAAPVYLFFVLIDRWYQYYRFGSFTSTYVSVFAREARMLNPSLPANYPWETPFHVGFFGALFKPEKSIFLFDPLLLLTILVCALAWKRFRRDVKAYVITTWLLLFAYICFYAKYTIWSGDFAWGDRYVSTAAELAAFISVPLLLRYRAELGRLDVANRNCADRRELRDSARFPCLLAAAGNLSNGHARSSDVCGRAAVQEHRRVRPRQDGSLGSDQRFDDLRSLGLRAHHDLELPSLPAAPRWRCAALGRECGVCGLVRRANCDCLGALAAAQGDAQRRSR